MRFTFFICVFQLTILVHTMSTKSDLNFYEEPSQVNYLTKTLPAILKCQIENALSISFKCNDNKVPIATKSSVIQIGNKQVLISELSITHAQLDVYKKTIFSTDSYLIPEFWCTCIGKSNSLEITSSKAYIKLAYIETSFDWEPMATSGLIGKAVEIRCLPPEADPKASVYWLRNGAKLEKANTRIIISHEGSLLINEVHPSDQANYTCVAENIAGQRLSDSAQLTVTADIGWSKWSNWTECDLLPRKCGEGSQKRTRTCLNPPTINNAIGCNGFPSQTITCYVACSGVQEAKLSHFPKLMQQSLNVVQRPGSDYWWTEWSGWSPLCDSECRRPRKRECKKGYMSDEGILMSVNYDDDKVLDKNLKMCVGPDIDYSNCTFFCQLSSQVTNGKKEIDSTVTAVNSKASSYQIVPTLVLFLFFFVIVFSILSFICCKNIIIKARKRKTKKPTQHLKLDTDSNNPIYYSVQPDYSANDPYNEACTIRSASMSKHNTHHQLQESHNSQTSNCLIDDLDFLSQSQRHLQCSNNSYLNSNLFNRSQDSSSNPHCTTIPLLKTTHPTNSLNVCHQNQQHSSGASSTTTSSDQCEISRTSPSTITSGTNSTTSSKIILTGSPTETLIKTTCILPISRQTTTTLDLTNNDYESNAYQIMQLINERKTCVYQAQKQNFDSFQFNLFKSGGLIEIPKYSMHCLVSDEIYLNEISLGLYRAQENSENVLDLKGDYTPLSAVVLVKTNHGKSDIYPKPIIISIDHSALGDTWETSVLYKDPTSNRFEEINENLNLNFYSKIVSNKFFMMTQRDGMYVLVGRPATSSSMIKNCLCLKEMKYAIVLVEGAIKVLITQNTRANSEILNEEFQKSNGRIIKTPEIFELNFPQRNRLADSFLNLDLNINYNNSIINSDSTCRKIRMADVWNSSSDFLEIEIPIINLKHFSANGGSGAGAGRNNSNFDLKVSLEFEQKTLFAYSNINANMYELHTVYCSQQEFYSSVSVNPVCIPLQITNLLDDYMLRCFKMNTLKKSNWKLFANLLKCDKNVEYFSNKDNSFELVLSLWLMINLSRSDKENISTSFTS